MKFWKKTQYWLSKLAQYITKALDLRFRFTEIAIFFLCLAIGFAACKKDDLIGLEVQPDSEKLGTINFDTLAINAFTVKEDSIPADETTFNLVGNYTDPVFGYSEASTYVNFRLSEEGFDFASLGNNLVADSIVLSMAYTTYYGKLNPADFIVNELTEEIYRDSVYYSDATFAYQPMPLGQKIGHVPNITDSVTVAGEKEPAQLRIRLSKLFAQQLLDAGSTVYASNEAFADYFKGVNIRPGDCKFLPGPEGGMMKGCNDHRGSGEGAIFYFNLLSGFSRLTLYFHDDTNENFEYQYYINSNSTRVNSFKHEYEGTPIQTALSNESTGDQTLYIQSMGGVKTKLEFPTLEALAQGGPIGINKAEVEINIETGSDATYPANPQLFLVGIDESGTSVFLPDQFEDPNYYGGAFNLDEKKYTFRINRYIQQLLTAYQNGEDNNFGLYLVAGSASITANRTIIKGVNSPDGRLKLNLSYTPL